MADLFREGYGPEVEIDEAARWHHLGTVLDPYVPQLLCLPVLNRHISSERPRQRVLNGGPQAAEDYKNFLKAGGSVYPARCAQAGRRGHDLARACREGVRCV